MAIQDDESAPQPADEAQQASHARVDRVNDELRYSGAWVFAGKLLPSYCSTVVQVHNGTTTMTDGPHTHTKEQLGGLWVIRAPDLDVALYWAERYAEARGGPIEVRPFDCTWQA
jgi:hypothetical protein